MTKKRKPTLQALPRGGLASLSTVMLIALTMVVLAGLYLLADPLEKRPGSLQAVTEDQVQALIDGRELNHPGTNGESPPSRPGDPPPEPPLGNGDDDDPASDGEDENDKGDPLTSGFGIAFATGLLGETLQQSVQHQSKHVAAAVAERGVAARARDTADLLLQRALRKGTASPAEIHVLRENLEKATQLLNHNRLNAAELTKELTQLERLLERAGTAASTFAAYQILLDAEAAAAKARLDGNYREAHRITCGAAAEFSIAVIAEFGGIFSHGLKDQVLQWASEKIATYSGRVAGDATFDTMVVFSHFLYRQPWWPKNIKPRHPLPGT